MKKQTPVKVPIKRPMRCRHCLVGTMRLSLVTDGDGKVFYRKPLHMNSTAYLDSG